jgi:hypothetical protein
MGSNPIRKTLPPYIGDKMKKKFQGHSHIDYDGLEAAVWTFRSLLGRANSVLSVHPEVEGYRDSLVLALAHAEKALEQF